MKKILLLFITIFFYFGTQSAYADHCATITSCNSCMSSHCYTWYVNSKVCSGTAPTSPSCTDTTCITTAANCTLSCQTVSCNACPYTTTCSQYPTYDTCDTSPCSAPGATSSTTFTCRSSLNSSCAGVYNCGSCAAGGGGGGGSPTATTAPTATATPIPLGCIGTYQQCNATGTGWNTVNYCVAPGGACGTCGGPTATPTPTNTPTPTPTPTPLPCTNCSAAIAGIPPNPLGVPGGDPNQSNSYCRTCAAAPQNNCRLDNTTRSCNLYYNQVCRPNVGNCACTRNSCVTPDYICDEQTVDDTRPGSQQTPTNSTICYTWIDGYIFKDFNRTGTKDDRDTYFAGTTVTLTGGPPGTPPRTRTITNTGYFRFDDIADSTRYSYTLTVSLPAGDTSYMSTTGGNSRGISLSNNNSVSGQHTYNFGFVPVFKISGNVYNDDNKNGIKDAAETGIGNVVVSINPAPVVGDSIKTVNSDGSYEFTNLYSVQSGSLTPQNYTIIISSLPTGYYVTFPRVGNSPQLFYNPVQIGYKAGAGPNNLDSNCLNTPEHPDYPTGPNEIGQCTPESSNSLRNPGDRGSNIVKLDFGLNNIYPWFQGTSGDMRLDNGFIDSMPGNPTPPPYSLLRRTSTDPATQGIIFSGDQRYNFCQNPNGATDCKTKASANGWLAGGNSAQTVSNPEKFTPPIPGVIRTSYSYIATTAKNTSAPTNLATIPGCINFNNCNLPNSSESFPNGLYRVGDLDLTGASADLHLKTTTFPTGPTGKNYVILVHGNLYIKGDITVPVGSTVTFTVSGNIYVDKAVGESTHSSSAVNIAGYYSADGSFIIEGNNNNCTINANIDKRLNMAGMVVANAGLSGGSFTNQRSLCGNDKNFPSFTIVERPDFIINAPDFLKQATHVWQEIAP